MSSRPSRSRSDSLNNDQQPHRPNNPSTLRQAVSANQGRRAQTSGEQSPASPSSSGQRSEATPLLQDAPHGGSSAPRRPSIHPAHSGYCSHGTFSPRPSSPTGQSVEGTEDNESLLGTGTETPGSSTILDSAITTIVGNDDWKKWLKKKMRTRKMANSGYLAQQAGLQSTTMMYLSYYIPCLTWMSQYKTSYLKGDLISALTMASFYLPMALSLASNLAHVPPIHGLYAFVFNPFIYALLGSCPQMVVGPEAAGSLLVGTVVKANVDSSGNSAEENDLLHAQICGVVAGMAGAMVLIAGLARLGFLDSVLSKPFLRGFISAIGFVIAVDQLIPELGLVRLADGTGVTHGSSVEKIKFMVENIRKAHIPTVLVAGISFVIIMICREAKNRFSKRFPSIVFVPDRFIVVVASALLCYHLRWDEMGVEILGEVKAASGGVFTFRWPFQPSQMAQGMSTSFLIALLGFFESSVAAKSLGGSDTIQGMQLSANRELIALGTANLIGASFMSLPAFGGYGRSKVNRTTGGKTPMSSIFLSLIALFSILFLLPYFYYLPKPVLSAMISVVAYSLIEEAPHDIAFFIRIRGWKELGLMALIFVATMFYSLTLGMALGVGVSLLLVIKHSTRPRIQILGRIPGTTRFENAESPSSEVDHLEFIEGCLIVKIPEPLTFANTGELRARLRRLEYYGSNEAHPALPRLRSQDANRNVIFDIHGVTSIDGSGTQVFEEIVRDYRERGVRVYFSRGPKKSPRNEVWRLLQTSGIVDLCGGERHFVNDVEEALKLTEYEESIAMGSGEAGRGSLDI